MSKMLIHLTLIAVVGLIAYSNTFQVPFVFDDTPSIVMNPVITSLDNFLSSSQGYTYSPRRFVGYFTFALNYRFGGLEVTGYHVVNLAIHIINALLVYVLVRLTLKTPYMRSLPNRNGPSANRDGEGVLIALFSALLFVAHPIQTQAVTYVVQRLTSLATMFYLLSVVLYLKGSIMIQNTGTVEEKTDLKTPGQSIFYLISSIMAAVLAMKTKEIAFTLPLIIILYEFTFFGSSLKKKLLFLMPVLFTLAIVPVSLMGTGKPLGELLSDLNENTRVLTNMPRWDYMMTQLRVITTYIRLLFFPAGQNLDYDYPVYHSLFTPSVFLSFLFLTSIFGLAAYLIYKARTGSATLHAPYYRLTGFGIVWFFLTLSVESSIIPIDDVIFEHRLYLPSVGAFTAITSSLFFVKDKINYKLPQIRAAFLPAFIVIIIVLLGSTYARNIIWQDRISLWSDVVQKSPFKARPYSSRGLAFAKIEQYQKSIEDFDRAIALLPFSHSELYNNRGVSYLNESLFDKAIEDFQIALALDPNNDEAYYNCGLAYYRRGNIFLKTNKKEIAIADFQKACNLGNKKGCHVLPSLGIIK